jgi:hypothetical protein
MTAAPMAFEVAVREHSSLVAAVPWVELGNLV